ncbi:MAG: hypothetical protein ACYCU7_03485 [Acidimicrobiales bacterium]
MSGPGPGVPPGWWLASDGRWYPPELHPSRRAAPPPAAPPSAAAPPATRSPGGSFQPIPAHPPLAPLSMRQSTPHRPGSTPVVTAAPPADGSPRPPAQPTRYVVQSTVDRANRPDLSLGPASLASGRRRHRPRPLPLGTVFVVVAVVLAAGIGVYWYRHRATPHSSAVDAAEAFVRDLYGGPPGAAQAMLVPGQQLSVATHPPATITFGVPSVSRSGADDDVTLVVCTTSNGRGCGAQSGNGTTTVVPTRRVDGRWYVDQSLLAPCGGPTSSNEAVVCQQ